MRCKFHKFNTGLKLEYIEKFFEELGVKYDFKGNYLKPFEGTCSLEANFNNSIRWCKQKNLEIQNLNNFIITDRSLELNEELLENNLFVEVEMPKFVYHKLLEKLLLDNLLDATTGLRNEIPLEVKGNYFISKKNTFIDPSTYISPGVVIYPNVKIGKNCYLGPNSVIGAQGFGIVKNPTNGLLEKVIHIGGVFIGDNVNIGSNTCIDAGMINETFIDSNVAINNRVHIAHNSRIMSGTIICAGCVITGGSIIKKNVYLSPNSVTLQSVVVGENSTLGAGTILRKSVSENSLIYGNPMKIVNK